MIYDFDEEGVLNIRPEDYYDVIVLKWFLREFSSHGARMLNVETEIKDENRRSGNQFENHPREFGFIERQHHAEPIYDPMPFNPQMEYDNRVTNIRDFRDYPREYGQRDGGGRGNDNRGERGRNGSGTQNTRDRDRDNQR
jgi:hypothetical protein